MIRSEPCVDVNLVWKSAGKLVILQEKKFLKYLLDVINCFYGYSNRSKISFKFSLFNYFRKASCINTLERLIFDPHGTKPRSEHLKSQIIRGVRKFPVKNSMTLVLVEKHAYETNAVITYVPSKP